MIPGQFEPLVNHLWQSTLLAAIAGLLTLALRTNRAQTRYWLWLAASVKFLVPFSILVTAGSYFGRHPVEGNAPVGVPLIIVQASQPFVAPASLMATSAGQFSSERAIPRILCAVWAIGAVILAFSWSRRWLQIRAALRSASPLPLPIGIQVMSSTAIIEPGVFGILRPVLLLPHGISKHLTPPQLEAVLSHELCHIRRRDNLAAAIHMVVEAVFWFHPMVWWLGACLMEERERACDEEVLRMGNEPEVYAQGILKICELYLESPLDCMAGVSGANLKKRIEDIMTNRVVRKLNGRRKMLLGAVGILAVAGPIAIGIGAAQVRAQSQQMPPPFEVASVKPYKGDARAMRPPQLLPSGRFTSRAPLLMVVAYAYNVPFYGPAARISGGPSWISMSSPEGVYDIEATAAKGAIPDGLSTNARTDKGRLMLQALLADRFKLVIRRQSKEMPVYALVVGKGGPKLRKSDIQEKNCVDNPDSRPEDWKTACHRFTGGRGRGLQGGAVDMSDLVDFVQGWTDRPLLDETGIKGLYHIETGPWLPMELGSSPPAPGATQDGADVADLPTLFTVFERLGLKMEARKEKVDVYVIEHIEKPTEN